MNASSRPRHALLAASAAALLLLTACGSDGGEGSETEDGLGLVDSGTLTACSNVPYPPFEVEDAQAPSGYSGFDIDLLQAIADELDPELRVEHSAEGRRVGQQGR